MMPSPLIQSCAGVDVLRVQGEEQSLCVCTQPLMCPEHFLIRGPMQCCSPVYLFSVWVGGWGGPKDSGESVYICDVVYSSIIA